MIYDVEICIALHVGSVETTIILTCMVFALIIVFTVVGCFFVRKTSTTIKEGLRTVPPQTGPGGVIKNV